MYVIFRETFAKFYILQKFVKSFFSAKFNFLRIFCNCLQIPHFPNICSIFLAEFLQKKTYQKP